MYGDDINKIFRVRVNNYGAQIRRADLVDLYFSREEAADAIMRAFADRIDEHLLGLPEVEREDNLTGYDEAAFAEAYAKLKYDIMESGYEDGDGHVYHVVEEDKRGPLYIVTIRSWFGPYETYNLEDDRTYLTVEEAREEIKFREIQTYVLAHNEASRPEYVIIGDDATYWLQHDDLGKYDWPEDEKFDVNSDEYDQQATADEATRQDIAYIREHAIAE